MRRVTLPPGKTSQAPYINKVLRITINWERGREVASQCRMVLSKLCLPYNLYFLSIIDRNTVFSGINAPLKKQFQNETKKLRVFTLEGRLLCLGSKL